MSPATCTCDLSIGLYPARSNKSLAASNWTYSDFALVTNLRNCPAATVALSPNSSFILSIRYCCTCGCFNALLALTLPDSPSAYPASGAACVIVQPFATIVSTNAVCFRVSFLATGRLLFTLAPFSFPPRFPVYHRFVYNYLTSQVQLPYVLLELLTRSSIGAITELIDKVASLLLQLALCACPLLRCRRTALLRDLSCKSLRLPQPL